MKRKVVDFGIKKPKANAKVVHFSTKPHDNREEIIERQIADHQSEEIEKREKIKQEVLKELINTELAWSWKNKYDTNDKYNFEKAIDLTIQKTTDYLMSSEANRVCYDGVMKLEKAQAIREVREWLTNELYYYATPQTIKRFQKNFDKKFGVK